jgi:hypothetical protein
MMKISASKVAALVVGMGWAWAQAGVVLAQDSSALPSADLPAPQELPAAPVMEGQPVAAEPTPSGDLPAPLEKPAAEGWGAIEVLTDPPGATVALDGQVVGKSPVRIDRLPAGPHTLQLAVDGGAPVTKTITVAAGVTSRLEQNLTGNPNRPQGATLGEPAPPPPKKSGSFFGGEFFGSFLTQPWAWVAAGVAGLALLAAALLWTTSTPASLFLVGTYLKDVRPEAWKALQVGSLVVAAITGLIAVALFIWPSLPFSKYFTFDEVKKLVGKKDEKATPVPPPAD